MIRTIKKGAVVFACGLLAYVLMTSHLSAAAPAAVAAPALIISSATLGADDGATLFLRNCAICHGKDGKGLPNWRAKGQPDFTDVKWQKSRTDAQISSTVQNGKGKNMPGFKSRLSDADVAAVVAQVRAFGKK